MIKEQEQAEQKPAVPYFDHNSPEYARDRFQWYRNIRAEHGPVAWSPLYGGFWIVLGRKELVEAAKDWETFSSEGVIEPETAEATAGCPVHGKGNGLFLPPRPRQVPLLEEDPPAWGITRRALNPMFLPGPVSQWRERIQTIVDAAIDQVIETGTVDFTADIAEVVSTVFSLELVGIEAKDPRKLAKAMNTSSHLAADDPLWAEVNAVVGQEAARIAEALGRQAASPTQGGNVTVIQTLLAARAAGTDLSDEKITELAMLVLGAGFDTTASVVGTSLMMVSENSELRRSLIDKPESISDTFEEFLRLSAPTSGLTRTVMRDTVLGGQAMRRGDRAMLLYAAANRDPNEFPEPDEFRVGRRTNRHVAFGSGLHRCLGAHYAQLEFEIILTTVLRRMPDFRIDAERAYKYDNIGLVDGWVTLPATFTPGPKVGAVVPGIGPA
ncbi:MAG TPA: cytochrome P450 [Novosphingobium sp.]|nr:cytochrome P450 [Novosphingobium sp.]